MLVIEVFSRLLLWLDDHGFLTPLGVNAVRNRCSLYADDVVLFLVPVERDLQVLKGALELFGKALLANLLPLCVNTADEGGADLAACCV